MRSLFHFRWLAVLAGWLGSISLAGATHILGGEVTYSSIASTTAGVPRYHIVAKVFRDVTKIDQPVLTLTFNPGNCSGTQPGSFMQQVPVTSIQSSYTLGCAPTLLPAYETKVYETDVDLPANRWTITAVGENRQDNILNMSNSINHAYAIGAVLDNTAFTQDASPKFESTLLPNLLGTQAAPHSFSAFDADGDSLAYQFVLPQQSASQAAISCGVDIAGTTLAPHFTLSPATGALSPVANAGTIRQGYYIMVARVYEYRRVGSAWALIGYVTRDITYLAYASTNASPRFTTLAVNQAAAAPLAGQLVRAQRGQTLQLALGATDPDAGQQLRFESQAPGVVPGLRLQTTGASTAQLTWQVPASLPLGRYTLTVAVLDNGCPNASEEQTISVLVTDQALAARPATEAAAEAYPLPFREQVQLRTLPGQAIRIVDALGRPVARLQAGPDGRAVWQPGAGLAAGVYFARAADGRLLARLLRSEQ